MAVPAKVLLNRSANTVFLAFDREISRVSGALPWDNGFTLTVNATPTPITVVTKVLGGITFQTGGTFAGGDTIQLAYAGTNLVDAATGLSAVATFSATTAPLQTVYNPAIQSATISSGTPNAIVIAFRDPITSLTNNPANGVSVTVNSVAISLSGATVVFSNSGYTLTITTVQTFNYSDTVQVIYTAASGDWVNPTLNATVSNQTIAILNQSSVGLPNSDYPLSQAIAKQLVASNNIVTAKVALYLNPVDVDLIAKYGPAYIDVGGTFGLPTVNPPTGYYVLGSLTALSDGLIISQDFNSTTTAWSIEAASDWQTTIVSRINTALGTLRLLGQSVSLGNDTITQV
jgi:hypothetical protein